MNWFPILCLATFSSLVYSEEVKTLCEDPIIHSADRLPNNTFRVYRDNHYWELEGLPNITVNVQGPFPVWYKYMAPMDRLSSVQTVVGGEAADGLAYKFRGQKYWIYRQNGELILGDKDGFDWSEIPSGGFNAVLNDGKMGGNDFPIMIGFSGIYVHYFNTENRFFRRIGSKEGYKNGKDGENFPPDLTAAFAFAKDENKKNNYSVYLFQRNRYCYRPLFGEEGCKQWRQNKELFGCELNNTSTESTNTSSIPEVTTEKPDDNGNEAQNTDEGGSGTFLIVIIVILLVVVAIVVGIVVFAMKGMSNKSQSHSNHSDPEPNKKIKLKVPESNTGESVKSKSSKR